MYKLKTVQLDVDPRGFATLWLNRPEKHNAFNEEMILDLVVALRSIQDDSRIRFLLLRGRGKHFSAGADLAWMQHSATLGYNSNRDAAKQLADLMYGLYELPIPTLAVVHGAAFGGAVGLVSCCDIAIGTPDAQFSLSEVRIGLAPAVISPFVVQAIGERHTRRYALTAERLNGERAQELGLLSECYPADRLEQEIDKWVANLLLNSPLAMRACKNLLQEIGTGALTPVLRRYTENSIARIRASAEGQEGLNAFLEKRTPAWQE